MSMVMAMSTAQEVKLLPNGRPMPPQINSWSPILNASQKIEDMKFPWKEYAENSTGDMLSYLPVMHGGGGAYYVNILVGSPPQMQPVDIAGNSPGTHFPCTGHNSKNFGKPTDPEFTPSESSTHHALTCSECPANNKLRGFRVGGYSWRKREKCEKLLPIGDNHTIFGDRCVYGDEIAPGHGWDAYAMRDQLWTSNQKNKKSAEVKMGCWYQNQGAYNETGMGILGLSRGNSDLINSLYDSKVIKQKTWSTCFSETGGSMAIGTEASDKTKWVPVQYSRSHWWKVEVTGVRVGEVKVAGKMSAWQEGKGTLVDTANTDTFIPAALAPQFKAAFEKATGIEYIEEFGLGQGYALTEAQMRALPSLYFDLNGGNDRLGGVTVEVRADAYTAKNEWKNGQYSYRLLLHATDQAGGVLGANALRNHRVTFDDANSRIGWEKMDCDKDAVEKEKEMKVGKPALYKMDGPEYFNTIGHSFKVKDKKKFDPLSVKKMPKWTKAECDGKQEDEMDKEIDEKEMKGGMKMDMGAKAQNWTDTVQCIPKGEVANDGIAPIITDSARTALKQVFAERIATGSGEHGERSTDVPYKFFQVPIPSQQILDHADFDDLQVVDSKQLTEPARMVVCHSVATSWVCHAPTATFFYAIKARAKTDMGGTELIDLTVMCHSSSPEEPKDDGTICHVTGAGDLAIYPTEIETPAAASSGATVQNVEGLSSETALLFLVVGWVLASVAIFLGFYFGRRNAHKSASFAAVPMNI